MRSSHGRSEGGSNIGSRIGALKASKNDSMRVLDPQQREQHLK